MVLPFRLRVRVSPSLSVESQCDWRPITIYWGNNCDVGWYFPKAMLLVVEFSLKDVIIIVVRYVSWTSGLRRLLYCLLKNWGLPLIKMRSWRVLLNRDLHFLRQVPFHGKVERGNGIKKITLFIECIVSYITDGPKKYGKNHSPHTILGYVSMHKTFCRLLKK